VLLIWPVLVWSCSRCHDIVAAHAVVPRLLSWHPGFWSFCYTFSCVFSCCLVFMTWAAMREIGERGDADWRRGAVVGWRYCDGSERKKEEIVREREDGDWFVYFILSNNTYIFNKNSALRLISATCLSSVVVNGLMDPCVNGAYQDSLFDHEW